MIDLAAATGVDEPRLMLSPERDRFSIERPPASPFVGGQIIGVGQESEGRSERLADVDQVLEVDAYLEEQLARLRRMVDRYPSKARPRANLGVALLNAGWLDEAATELAAAATIDPRDYSATASLGHVRVQQNRLDEAEALYRRLRVAHPHDANPVIALADIEVRRERLDDSVHLWREAIALQPNSSDVYANLGVVLCMLGRYSEAIAALKQGLHVDVRGANTYHTLGVAYALEGQLKRAVRCFRTALNLVPLMADATESLSTVLLANGQVTEAIDVLESYVAKVSGDFEALEQLGRAYTLLANYRSARLQLIRALNALSESGDADLIQLHRARLLNNLGACSLRLSAFDEAGRHFLASMTSDPTASVPFQNLARLQLEQGRAGEAAKTLRACADRFPADEEARLLLAYALNLEGKSDQAIAEMRDLVETTGASPQAWAVLGALLTDGARRPTEAVSVLESARLRWPNDPILINNLAYAHLMNEEPRAARVILGPILDSEATREPHEEVVLRATSGLLHIWEGDLESGTRRYQRAAEVARQHGYLDLSAAARQKMHLELARAHLRSGDKIQAFQAAKDGLNVPSGQYRRDLRSLVESLRAEMRESRSG